MSSLARIEAAYVVDTHSLIWYLTNAKKLGKQAAEVFAAAERGETQLIISAVVIAEMYYANKKHSLFPDFAQAYQDLKANPQYQFHDFTPDDVSDFEQDAAVPEMHDRIIAGLARRLNAPLITSDPQIITAAIVKVVW